MEELILYIVKNIVSKPDEVTVEDGGTREGATVYNLKVADDDKGFVIGRQGRVAKALRAIVKAAAAKEGQRINIDIIWQEQKQQSTVSETDQKNTKNRGRTAGFYLEKINRGALFSKETIWNLFRRAR